MLESKQRFLGHNEGSYALDDIHDELHEKDNDGGWCISSIIICFFILEFLHGMAWCKLRASWIVQTKVSHTERTVD